MLTTSRSAAENMWGYFSGLSSPSVTEMTTTRAVSPRSNSAGHTRFPTFSTNTTLSVGGSSASSPRRSMSASRWHPAPVLICTTGTPVDRMRSASRWVSWSPSMTATGRAPWSSPIVRCSNVVLPDPGELIMLSATIRRSASQRRLSLRQRVVAVQDVAFDLDGAAVAGGSTGAPGASCAWPGSPAARGGDEQDLSVAAAVAVDHAHPGPGRVVAATRRTHRSGHLHRADRELPAGQHVDVGAAARAQQDQVVQDERRRRTDGSVALPSGSSMSRVAPWSGVPSVTRSKQKRTASGTTPDSRPTLSRPRRPVARPCAPRRRRRRSG